MIEHSLDRPGADRSGRARFLQALQCLPLDRPPVWLMRQAGRYLPEYRALKQKHGFLKMVQTPALAMEVTLQPLRRFPLDAAILFADILVIPEALGQPYRFLEEGGIGMEFRLESAAQVKRLDANGIEEKLAYVGEALQLLRSELGESKALLGFGGSPWTLAAYMVEGRGSDSFPKLRALLYEDRPLFHLLMEKLTEALISYFRMQAEAGADALQIFDTWAGILPGSMYGEASYRWIAEIAGALEGVVPLIHYSRSHAPLQALPAAPGISALSLDWTVDLASLAPTLPSNLAVQGNLDPLLPTLSPEIAFLETTRFLDRMKKRPGHILNLGHGLTPDARPETVGAIVAAAVEHGQDVAYPAS